MKALLKNAVLLSLIFLGQSALAASSTTPVLILTPGTVIQGEPAMVILDGVKISDIKKATYDKQPLAFFLYKNKPTALVGVDINKKIGTYEISFILNDGSIIKNDLTVTSRDKKEEVLAVPEKLGGNSPANQTKVVSELSKENAILAGLFTGKKSFWTESFKYPIANPIVTDPYGYSRLTGAYTITHKGADFRAKTGTKVTAMNRGVVRLVRNFQTYGKTIVIDHGLGLSSYYMHLSKIYVNEGELVKPGQLIGLSGQTGYAEFPHLHLSVKINQISIDPIKFMALFK
ncbi:MAG: M23 family metallopeptidase [bacterium]